MEIKDKLLLAFSQLVDSTIVMAPKVVVGIVLVIAGLLFTKLIEVVLRVALQRMRFDTFVGKVGVDKLLHRLGLRQELSIFIPRFVYFLVLFVLAQTSADALGLVAISSAIGSFFAYLPNIVAALLLLIVGSSLGQFAGDTVARSAEASGLDVAQALGRVVSGGIFFVCAMMAISQLKIDTAIVRIVTSIILGGAALAFGLSFGFGTRETIRNIAAGFYARRILVIGQPLEILGQRGVLKSITATHMILNSENNDLSISNSSLLHNIAKQEVRD